MGPMNGYDPNLGLGKEGYAKAMAQHVQTMNDHLNAIGMNAKSNGAKQVVEGIHKAAMERMFPSGKPQPNMMGPGSGMDVIGMGAANPGTFGPGATTGVGNANSTPIQSRGTSSGFMISH